MIKVGKTVKVHGKIRKDSKLPGMFIQSKKVISKFKTIITRFAVLLSDFKNGFPSWQCNAIIEFFSNSTAVLRSDEGAVQRCSCVYFDAIPLKF